MIVVGRGATVGLGVPGVGNRKFSGGVFTVFSVPNVVIAVSTAELAPGVRLFYRSFVFSYFLSKWGLCDSSSLVDMYCGYIFRAQE